MTIKKIIPMLLLALSLSCGAALAAEDALLNINTATAEEISAAVPGLGLDICNGIVEYREAMGDIQDMSELLEVKGMTKDILEQLKKHVGLGEFLGSECNC